MSTTIEWFGSLQVHQPVKEVKPEPLIQKGDPASPGTWDGLTYTCACNGCWACSGTVAGCTCDVDWSKVYGHE